ncbi:MAG TPA: tetratricopeptide repeat protein [Casimicrobiaceae bacterium]
MSAPDDGAWLARGQAHRRAGRTVDALLCYREALKANRYAIQAHFHLGEALQTLGRDGEAFDAWHAVLTLQPRHLPALLAFGAAARRIGKRAESAEAYRRALAFAPQDAQARRGLALTRLAAGEPDAYREIERSLSDDAIGEGVGEDVGELAQLLLAAPRSPGRQALLADVGRRAEASAAPLLAAMLADDSASRDEPEQAKAMLDAAERGAATIASLDALRLFAHAAAKVAPQSPWAARYAAHCIARYAPDVPLPWPRRTSGAALRVAYLIAPGRPLVVGAEVVDPNDYLREVVAAHARERIEPLVYIVDAAGPSASAAAALAGTTVTVLGPAPDAAIAQLLAEADFDAVVDLAGMAAATGPLLARRPARSVWTLDTLHAAHVAPLVTHSLPAPRSGADDALRTHRIDVEATLAAALAPGFSSAADCPLSPPAMARLWRDAVRAHQAQDADAAIAAYRAVLAQQPGFARAHYLLGLLLRDLGPRAEALRELTAAVRAAPAFVDARAALANLLREREGGDAAIEVCREGLAVAPQASVLWRALGLAELGRSQGRSARAAFDRALACEPGDAETHYNRGVALQVEKKRCAALNAYRRALALAPDLAVASFNAGVVLREQGHAEAAIAAFEHVIAQEPAHVAAHNALCETLHEGGRIDEWLRAFKRFEAHCPDALPLAVQALEACQYQADFAAVDRYLDGLRRDAFKPAGETELADCLETLLFLILYFDIEPADVLRLYRTYAAVAPRVYGPPVAPAPSRRPGRIRVGYLSGDLRDHVMGKMMWEAVRRHDRGRFELFFYSLSSVSDQWTARYRGLGDRFASIAEATEREAAARIAEDNLDLLVDLATNTRGAKPGILALKPARVQITHVASAGVVGLRTIDFKLTDAFADLPGNQASQLETLLPIAGCVYPYRHIAPAVVHPYRRDRLGIAAGAVVIAAFVNPMKLSRRCLALWREVLDRIPRALLAISPLSSGAGDAQRRLFAAAGIAQERTIVLPAGRSEAENQARYHVIDFALDPLPYGGVNGTLEALDMGVPVVTLCGSRHGERSTYSILANLGVLETVAHSASDYVAIAARLASDRTFMAQVKAAIRAGLAGSPLTDMDAYTRHLERAYLAALEQRYPAALAGSRDG